MDAFIGILIVFGIVFVGIPVFILLMAVSTRIALATQLVDANDERSVVALSGIIMIVIAMAGVFILPLL